MSRKKWTIKDIQRLQGLGYVATSVPAPGLRQAVKYAIGIDPGVNTGIAVWDRVGKVFTVVTSTKIHTAMFQVIQWQQLADSGGIIVRLEDARQRTWFGAAGKDQLQGAGSIKRDCTIWQDFLEEKGIPFELVPPRKNKTKVTQAYFLQVSGWREKTNNHARDAGMLVLNY
jgi:hypothetical protein